MAWFWQQQINYENITGVTTVERDTGWVSPNIFKKSNTSELFHTRSEETSGRKAQIFFNDEYNLWTGTWMDMENINNNDYSFSMTPNGLSENKLIALETISFSDFSFNLPTESIIKGIELKITRQAFGTHGMLSQNEDDTLDGMWTQDKYYFDNNYTHYTYDKVVTISKSSDRWEHLEFENKKNIFRPETFGMLAITNLSLLLAIILVVNTSSFLVHSFFSLFKGPRGWPKVIVWG